LRAGESDVSARRVHRERRLHHHPAVEAACRGGVILKKYSGPT
jgi:hypothetical protein